MSVFLLKMIAVITMLMDHMGEFMPDLIPVAFRWAGRISAPLFMFCVIQGLVHTRNRKKYLIRIYAGAVIMAVGNIILNSILPNANVSISNNIFTTLLMIGLLITIAESKITPVKKTFVFLGFSLFQIAVAALCVYITVIVGINDPVSAGNYVSFIGAVLPSIIYCEGGLLWVLLGILMYVFRNNKIGFSIMYIVYSLIQMALTFVIGFNVYNLLYQNYQWMMIVSLFLILAYNGEKGRGGKYFFYLFYPLHIWILFLLSNVLHL